jgi:hypothetical protein
MMKKISPEEILILVLLIVLVILGFLMYLYPTQFFMIYDKILFFMIE